MSVCRGHEPTSTHTPLPSFLFSAHSRCVLPAVFVVRQVGDNVVVDLYVVSICRSLLAAITEVTQGPNIENQILLVRFTAAIHRRSNAPEPGAQQPLEASGCRQSLP